MNDVAARSELRRTRGRARGSSFESSTFFAKFVLDKKRWRSPSSDHFIRTPSLDTPFPAPCPPAFIGHAENSRKAVVVVPLFKDCVPAMFAKPSGPIMAAGQRSLWAIVRFAISLTMKEKACKSICLTFFAKTMCNVFCGMPSSFSSLCSFLFRLVSSGLEHSGSNDHGITKVAASYH